jgi:hypothetical protein
VTDLDAAVEQIEWAIRTILERLPAEGRYPPDDEGDLTNLARYYRLRGIASYLGEGDLDAYANDLYFAGQARLYYLRGCASGATGSERFYRTTSNAALFDALAVGDLSTAEEIALLCDERFIESLDYEDDFLSDQYLQTLFLAVRGRRSPSDASEVLNRLGRVASPQSVQLSVTRALDSRDPTRIAGSLRELTEARARKYKEAADRGDLPRIILQTERNVDVQLVGILRFLREADIVPLPEGAVRAPVELCELSSAPLKRPTVQAWRGIH